MPNNRKNIFLLVITISICLILSELFLNIIEPIRRSKYPKDLFIKDSQNGYSLAKNFKGKHIFPDHEYFIKTNDFGCFEKDIDPKLVDILILGDSHTFGYVSEKNRYSNLLREKYNLNSYNCAVTGSGTIHQLNTYKNLIKRGFQPKILILGYVPFNDPEDDALHPRYTVWNGSRLENNTFGSTIDNNIDFSKKEEIKITKKAKLKLFLYENSALIRYGFFLRKTFNSSQSNAPSKKRFPNRLISNKSLGKDLFDQNISNLNEFNNLTKNNKTRMIVLNIPISEKYCFKDVFKGSNYLIKKIKAKKIELIEQKVCESKELFHRVDAHLNNQGHESMAKKIFFYLNNNIY